MKSEITEVDIKNLNQMPQWQSHKIVKAAEIHAWQMDEDRINAQLWLMLRNPDGILGPITVSAGVFARYAPSPGDYYVLYEDGYQSVSPKKAFEEGYVLVRPVLPPYQE